MKVLKKIKNIVFLLVLITYLFLVSAFINEKSESIRVGEIQIHVLDKEDYHFIDTTDVTNMLNRFNFHPIGRAADEIDLEDLENYLERQQIIKNAEGYITEPGVLHIDITQKSPFIRVFNQSGQGYYLDKEGNIIPLFDNYSPFVLVANGSIGEPFSISETVNIFETDPGSLSENQRAIYDLYHLALFIDGDDFWKSQIEQIFVNKKLEFELVPRVGPHIIEFGKAENTEEKFSNLRLLYTQALNNTGWNQYLKISLKYKNQVVCTKIQ